MVTVLSAERQTFATGSYFEDHIETESWTSLALYDQ
jgi:hypothetical protein